MSLTIDIHPHWWLLILWSAVGIALLRVALLRLGFTASFVLQRDALYWGLNIYTEEIDGSYEELHMNRMLRFTTITMGLWPVLLIVHTPMRYVKVPHIEDPNPPNEHSA